MNGKQKMFLGFLDPDRIHYWCVGKCGSIELSVKPYI